MADLTMIAVASARSSQASALLATLLAMICLICAVGIYSAMRFSKMLIQRSVRLSRVEAELESLSRAEREALVARSSVAVKIGQALGGPVPGV